MNEHARRNVVGTLFVLVVTGVSISLGGPLGGGLLGGGSHLALGGPLGGGLEEE